MKSTFILLSLFLLVAITTYLPATTAQGAVLDIEGNPLRNGGTYYILPAFRGYGGGIELAQTGTDTCPLTVAQSSFVLSDGLPIIISSPYRILFITENLPLNLAFSENADLRSCTPTPPKWYVVKDELVEDWSIKLITDDSEEIRGSFHIQTHGLGSEVYQLVFHSDDDDAVSGTIGIDFDNDGIRHLAVKKSKKDKYPFLVQFKLADGSSVAA